MRPVNLFLMTAFIAAPALAQDVALAPAASSDTARTEAGATKAKKAMSLTKQIDIQFVRPTDQRGVNVFETPKRDATPFHGVTLGFGAAFAQQFQGLRHENTADSVPTSATVATNANRLLQIGNGANLATANLYLDAQLAPGIRVALTSYLSSRHHQETWVKDGYLQIDGSPLDHPLLNRVFEVLTIKAGHFEVNYGDAHFRRTDNGMALYNPFVGNLIMDGMTTEIGGEVYLRDRGFMLMGGVTTGENKGNVTQRQLNAPAYYGKAGVDRQLTRDLRTRLTGSWYRASATPAFTLFGGDRSGSRYYLVLENAAATTTANFTSGNFNPGFSNSASAVQINPFVKFRGLEVFGVIERGSGKKLAEASNREVTQYASDVVYRFGRSEKAFLGYRWNTVSGELLYGTGAAATKREIGIDRNAASAGWFITPSLLTKVEYVTQKYEDFPTTDIRNGGKFNGFMIEGVVAF